MTIELCDRCCKQLTENNRYEIYVPTTTPTENGKVYNNTKLFVCSECACKFIEMVNDFKKGYTRERIENIQSLNLF